MPSGVPQALEGLPRVEGKEQEALHHGRERARAKVNHGTRLVDCQDNFIIKISAINLTFDRSCQRFILRNVFKHKF